MMKSRDSIFRVCVFLFGCAAFNVSADSAAKPAEIEALLPGLGKSEIDQLIDTGELSHMIEHDQGPLLVPGPDFRAAVKKDLEAIDYSIGVEVLNLIPGEYNDLDMITAANLLLEVSTLESLEYYSASRERMRTLFVQSYVIDDAVHENRVDDPTLDAIPASGELTMFQEDLTFGKNKLKINYVVTPATIHMVTENITTFSWGPIPLIRPGNLRLHVVIYKGENFLLYYGNFGAKALRIGILEKRIYNSFHNRLVALYGWFERKLSSGQE